MIQQGFEEFSKKQFKKLNGAMTIQNDRILYVETALRELDKDVTDLTDMHIEFRDYVINKLEEHDKRFELLETRMESLERRMGILEQKMGYLIDLITGDLIKIKERLNIV